MKNFLSIFLSIVSIAYSIYYASLGGFKGNSAALSKIGLNHPVLFFIWGILTFAALYFNIFIAFKKTKHKFQYILMSIALIGMLLTLCFDFDYSQQTDYWLHCIGSMTFSIISGITVFLVFLLNKEQISAIITGAILIIDLVLLLIFKETAIIELFPIFSGYILLGISNVRKENKKIEIKQ